MIQDRQMAVTEVPTSEIYADHTFNCRGFINGLDVVDLAKSIKEEGLLQPIVIQPFTKSDDPAIKYRIIAGYRRFTACRVNKMETIPAIIREHMSDEKARILNLTENLKRKDLNKLQETEAIQPLLLKGYTDQELAKVLGVSYGWVQIRTYISELDEHIKKEVAAGLLTDMQIRHLHKIRDPEKQYEYVKEVKKQKQSGKRKADIKIDEILRPKSSKRVRGANEILDMVEKIVSYCGGGTLATLFGAWCAANIDDWTLHSKIKEEAAKAGKIYVIPDYIQPRTSSEPVRDLFGKKVYKIPTVS